MLDVHAAGAALRDYELALKARIAAKSSLPISMQIWYFSSLKPNATRQAGPVSLKILRSHSPKQRWIVAN